MRAIYTCLLYCLTGILAVSCQKKNDKTIISQPGDYSAIDQILTDSVPSVFGGKCFAVLHINGQPAYSRSFGGYTGDTRLLIASCTKWLSAAVLMRLADEGKINLTDTAGKYLPILTANGKGKITIAQLFSHTSGFPGNSQQGYESDAFTTLEAAVNNIARNVPLQSTPGTTFNYGGVSMQVAGRICEVVSGKDWKTLAAEKIFRPCGMNNTDYGLTANPLIGGGARSTANDYMKFLNMLLQKGVASNGTRVLSAAAIAAMEQGYTGLTTVSYSPYPLVWLNTTQFYGIGNWRDFTGAGGTLIENSSPGAFGSHPWINHEKNITGMIFTFLPDGYLTTAPTCLKIRKALR
ncbi:beta-lactamase family protein [Chitinophaga sp. Mgbs1]|uniref:Beta-lactamase family protein n=1 Tax=Chitinophaga solisilvae TaxID=1233460 RepID=A0A433WLJ0_9BACT|nr:beta-lactamase family protein [Chitinophaga solisilvae]